MSLDMADISCVAAYWIRKTVSKRWSDKTGNN